MHYRDENPLEIETRHGDLVIVEQLSRRWLGEPLYEVRCDCGSSFNATKESFRSLSMCKRCIADRRAAPPDHLKVGDRSGRRTVVSIVTSPKWRSPRYEVACQCGVRGVVSRGVFLHSGACRRCSYLDITMFRRPKGAWTEARYEDHPEAIQFVYDHPTGATLNEVAQAMGLTRERIRQIEFAAKRKIQKELIDRNLYTCHFEDVENERVEAKPTRESQSYRRTVDGEAALDMAR